MGNETQLAVILHADVVGSTRLVQQDEHLAHDRIQEAFNRFAEIASFHGGRTHEIRGDALVAEFRRASDAATAALAFQAKNLTHNEELEGEIRPVCRIGIALGEVIIADGTVTGAGVVLAQRLEQLAEPGGVCISAAIREALPERLPFDFNDLGEQTLKGFERRQRAFAVRRRSDDEPNVRVSGRGAPQARSVRASIAVLPFDNLSTDPELEFFVVGMAEDIITALSKFRSLRVIARNSSFSFKGQALDVATIAERLGVRYCLEGSLRVAGSTIRITAQLIDAAQGAQHVWAERYDRSLDDVFAIQDELTSAVVTRVAPHIQDAELERLRRKPPATMDAWSAVWLAYDQFTKRTQSGLEEALRLARRAIELDPGYATAYATAANMETSLFLYADGSSINLEETRTLAETAVRLDPHDPETYFTLCWVLTFLGDRDGSIAAGEKAVSLNPYSPNGQICLGIAHQRAGDPEAALGHLDTALELNPPRARLYGIYVTKGSALRALGRYDEAIAAGMTACRMGPGMYQGHADLAASLALAGRMDDAQTELARAVDLKPDLTIEFQAAGRGHNDPKMQESLRAGLRKLGLPEV